MLDGLPSDPRILDVGCGTGIQTIELARLSGGKVIGVDNHQHFLDVLNREAKIAGLDDRITIENGDMFNLDHPDEFFDVIWSEGAIYIMGFKEGITNWKRMLKSGGYLVASDATWFKVGAPDDILDFWNEEYPAMTTVERKLDIISSCGYEVIGHFHLPEDAWYDFYGSLARSIEEKKEKYHDVPEGLEFIKVNLREIDLYKQFHDYYGYEFYIMRKP